MTLFDLVYHAAATLILVLGTFIVVNNFRQRNSWIFFLWALNASAWMLTLYWGFWLSGQAQWTATLITFRFAFATSVLMLSLMTVFFYYFPRVITKAPFWLRFLYSAFTIFLTVASLTPLIHKSIVVEDGIYISDVLGPLYPMYTFAILLNFFITLVLAIQKFRNVRGIERAKLIFSTGGYFVFIFFAILTNVVLPYFGIFILFLQNLVPILTVVFVIPAFIALNRYRFFNLSYVSSNVIRYIILLAAFVVSSAFLVQIISLALPDLNVNVIHTGAAIGGLFIFELVRKKNTSVHNRKFQRIQE